MAYSPTKWWIARSAFLALCVVGAIGELETATLHVAPDGSAPFSSIQSAIDAATPGQDELFVSCGRYFENITMRDGVSVEGEDPRCTFVDPSAPGQPVVELPNVGANTTLRGFTIENRPSLSPGTRGILVAGGAPVITQNVVRGDGAGAPYSGPGIDVALGAPVITYNVIRGNHACCAGGGIALGYDTSARVRSNLIVGNSAYYGAGIYAGLAADAVVTNNTIARNAGWVGGGLLVTGTGVVANNAIVFNTAVIYGGGVTDWSAGTALVGNDVYGNVPDEYSGADPTGSDGNIATDPEFIDESIEGFNGFAPRSTSPLIDRALAAWTPQRDLRGIPRTVDGDANGVPVGDIGARENEGVSGLRHDAFGFVWDPGRHVPHDFNLYRGDLATLRLTGVYTQDPATGNGARQFCDISNQLADADEPDPGQVFFYLPVSYGAIEGSLGFDSLAVERPKTRQCVGP